jgi:hypothetical protein
VILLPGRLLRLADIGGQRAKHLGVVVDVLRDLFRRARGHVQVALFHRFARAV